MHQIYILYDVIPTRLIAWANA